MDQTTPRQDPAGPPVLSLLEDLPRQQAAVFNESLCAMLRSVEHMRRIQAQAAHQALQRHQAAFDRLARGSAPDELARVQLDLWSQDSRACVHYWQALGHAMMEMNQGLFTRLCQWGGPAAVEGARQVTDAASVMSGLGEPFAWHPPQPRRH